jgi:hypothetical protein
MVAVTRPRVGWPVAGTAVTPAAAMILWRKTDALGPGRRGHHHAARRTSRPFASMRRWAWRVNLAQVRKLPWAQQSSMRAIRRSGTPL